MTKRRIIGSDTEYCDWLRKHPELDSKKYKYDRRDLDMSWFAYTEGKIMLISVKTHGAHSDASEKDTYGIWHQCAKYACPRIEFDRIFPNRTKRIAYYGYHEVCFELEGPRKGWIEIDGHFVTIGQLFEFHKFVFFPIQQEIYSCEEGSRALAGILNENSEGDQEEALPIEKGQSQINPFLLGECPFGKGQKISIPAIGSRGTARAKGE